VKRARILKIIYILAPLVVFYFVYWLFGIFPAIIFSGALSVFGILHDLARKKSVALTKIYVIVGLAFSFAAIYFTGNEKLYYVPALVGNVAFAGFIAALTARGKSVLHLAVKDFDIESIKDIDERTLRPLNLLWLAFFSVKAAIKVIGIMWLDFSTLYWMVFIFGDPMTVVFAGYSVYFVNRKIAARKKPQSV